MVVCSIFSNYIYRPFHRSSCWWLDSWRRNQNSLNLRFYFHYSICCFTCVCTNLDINISIVDHHCLDVLFITLGVKTVCNCKTPVLMFKPQPCLHLSKKSFEDTKGVIRIRKRYLKYFQHVIVTGYIVDHFCLTFVLI